MKINGKKLRKIISESIAEILNPTKKVDESIMGLSDVSETPSVEDFYNYVVNRFREEGIEIGDAGDDEELLQGCGNYDYETVPFEQLYPEVKRDWIAYKSEQNQYHGINESLLSKLISESITKILMEDMLTNDYPAYVVVDDSCDAITGNYDNVQDAVNDADESALNGGSYSVFGCVNDVYDDDTLVYCTSGNRDSWKF